ncbi:MAG TPA: (Fe-S)-binding protein, partial [Clostridiales bacterium]|nr:(Fe-S)-binding protein [Clostridiales bacterium]
MKSEIEGIIKKYVEQYPEIKNVQTRWYEPLIFYAAANDEMFNVLKKAVSETHALPKDLMRDGQTVVAYFLPFDVSVVRSNIEGRECSKIWATAYIETNQLIWDLNNHIKNELEKAGHKSNIIPATHNFNEEKLMSDWSHRHVAYVAGMGTFGINNMLITDKGCCGRIGTFITDVKLEPTGRKSSENCLY